LRRNRSRSEPMEYDDIHTGPQTGAREHRQSHGYPPRPQLGYMQLVIDVGAEHTHGSRGKVQDTGSSVNEDYTLAYECIYSARSETDERKRDKLTHGADWGFWIAIGL
jgi:hypothetical protein